MLTMSPSWITVESGMPWQMTSLRLVQHDFGKRLVAQGGRVRVVVDEELVHHPVHLVGGDAGRHHRAARGQRPGGDAACVRASPR